MKKIKCLLLIMYLIVITGCNRNQFNMKGTSTMDIEFEQGIFNDKNWDENIGTYKKDVIPNKETAVAVAVQIFNGMEKKSYAEKYVPQSVFYDEVDGIWIVSFWEENNNDEMITLGNDCSIALKKNNGQILRIWFGE